MSQMLTAQSNTEFTSARQKAFIEEWLSAFTGKNSDLLSFEEVKERLSLHDSTYKGLQEIELDKIIGSTGRYRDFTRTFLPKNNMTEERWRRVDAVAHDEGYPPIEVFQVGDVYFVRDGNHRVSVARMHEAKTIEAYVIEYRTLVSIEKDDTMDDILLKAERATFLKKTKLDQIRPDQELVLTEPGRYPLVEQHIAFHKYLKEREFNREISYDEAVASWYDTVYTPIVKLIREREVLKEFPGRTEADLYAWSMLHRSALEEEMEALGFIPNEDVLEGVKKEGATNPITRLVSYFNYQLSLPRIPLKVERAKFLADTKLDELRPSHSLNFTEPGCYQMVREHIAVHKYLREIETNSEISYETAVTSWYDTVYCSIINLVRERNLLTYFPDNSEADLYLWLVSRRAALEEENQTLGQVTHDDLVKDLETQSRTNSWTRWLPLFRQKLDLQSLLPR